MSALYAEDLAYIQEVGFAGMASAVAPEIVALLGARGLSSGTIGDIGCGAGVTTRHFLDAGYEVWALEPSTALLERARATAPEANFLPPASVYESHLPRANAIVAIGEPLSYHRRGSPADQHVAAFFVQAAAALRPGGILIFDVIVRGEPPLHAKTWSAGEDWAVLVEAIEDVQAGWLRRDLQFFRRLGDSWRRSKETHDVRVFDSDALRSGLIAAGFGVQAAETYGNYRLLPRRRAFVCERT
jgi:SAM-dependent methyltransferase